MNSTILTEHCACQKNLFDAMHGGLCALSVDYLDSYFVIGASLKSTENTEEIKKNDFFLPNNVLDFNRSILSQQTKIWQQMIHR